eukprot:scaffold37125_cov62-Phaeocystis_antarctica.AAC.6
MLSTLHRSATLHLLTYLPTTLPAPGAATAPGGVCTQLCRPAARQGRGRSRRADARGRGRLRAAGLRVHAGRVRESGVGAPFGRAARWARESDGSARGGGLSEHRYCSSSRPAVLPVWACVVTD